MFEIADPVMRARKLREYGHVENTFSMSWGEKRVPGVPISDDRTTADGKTSAVHFLKFPMTTEQLKSFLTIPAEQRPVISIDHERYGHAAVLPAHLVALLKSHLTKGY